MRECVGDVCVVLLALSATEPVFILCIAKVFHELFTTFDVRRMRSPIKLSGKALPRLLADSVAGFPAVES